MAVCSTYRHWTVRSGCTLKGGAKACPSARRQSLAISRAAQRRWQAVERRLEIERSIARQEIQDSY